MFKKLLEGDKLKELGYIEFSKKDHLYYKVEKFLNLKYKKKKAYLARIVALNKMKISKYDLIFDIQKEIVKKIKELDLEMSFSNTSIVSIIELREGLGFIPDISIITKALKLKKSFLDIDSAGLAIVIPDEYPKQQKLVTYVINRLARGEKLCVKRNVEEALVSVKTYLTLEEGN